MPDVIGLESGAKAAEMRLIYLTCAVVENDQCGARSPRCVRQRRQRVGPRLGRDRGIVKPCNKRGHDNSDPKLGLRNLTNLGPFEKRRVDAGRAISEIARSHRSEIRDIVLTLVKALALAAVRKAISAFAAKARCMRIRVCPRSLGREII